MARLHITDVAPGGYRLSGATVEDLPELVTLRQILVQRLRSEVASYNRELGTTFHGLVQPADAVRYSDGFRMTNPRALDEDHLFTAVEEAVNAGLVVFRFAERTFTELDEELDLGEHDQLTIVMRRPIIARVDDAPAI